MCVMSMVTTGMGQQWPSPDYWSRPDLQEIADILKRLDAIDKKLGAPNCVEPAKEEFLKGLDERLKALEAKGKKGKKRKAKA